MKKLLLILSGLIFFAFESHAEIFLNSSDAFTVAKAVKLGRGHQFFYGKTSLNNGNFSSLAKDCEDTCADCDRKTGICSVCKSGYYLKNNTCTKCPANASCSNGTSFVCGNYFTESTDSCLSICSNVTCVPGTTPYTQTDRCCCY